MHSTTGSDTVIQVYSFQCNTFFTKYASRLHNSFSTRQKMLCDDTLKSAEVNRNPVFNHIFVTALSGN